MLLIVSLPLNDRNLASAAADSGADMLKVHINAEHRASGTVFGRWQDERDAITGIIESVQIPVGIMPGAETVATHQEWKDIEQAGISFFDIYAHHMPIWMWNLNVKKMPAISEVIPAHLLLALCAGAAREGGEADYLEASIVSAADYGKPLTALDLANYRFIADALDIPVIVPTQKKIETGDLESLKHAGIGGLMIGAIVTGITRDEMAEACSQFRKAIDSL